PDPVEVTINGKVILQGKELEADQFTITLTLPNLTTMSTKNKADGSFAFPTQIHPLPGNYTYTIYQEQGSAEGVTYSGMQYSVNLEVALDTATDELDYNLTTTKNGEAMKAGEAFVFINSYSEVVGEDAGSTTIPALTVLPKTGK
ncbi:MAG TPA: FctA domain-containing protein, partial [bacterium]|nr:FctA domain-containing protein [bacterium]